MSLLTIVKPTQNARSKLGTLACDLCDNCTKCCYLFKCDWYHGISNRVPVINVKGEIIKQVAVAEIYKMHVSSYIYEK